MKRIRLIVMVVVVMVIGVLAIACFRAREPRYQGRTLWEWIENSYSAYCKFIKKPGADRSHPESDPDYLAASRAVQQMGPDAIPFLLRWVQAKDPPLKLKLIYWLDEHPSLHFKFRSDHDRNFVAVLGFSLLGNKAKPAWPFLVKLTYAPDADLRSRACGCLAGSKADKETLLPVFLRLIHDPDQRVRIWTANDFRYRYPQDAEAAMLGDTHSSS